MDFFGLLPYVEQFFPTQGGVFHIVMAVAYGLAAREDGRNRTLLLFIITAKFMATIFLLIYSAFVASAWVLLLSAVGDGLLGLLILLAYRRTRWTS